MCGSSRYPGITSVNTFVFSDYGFAPDTDDPKSCIPIRTPGSSVDDLPYFDEVIDDKDGDVDADNFNPEPLCVNGKRNVSSG